MHLGHIGGRIDIIGKVNEESSRLGGSTEKREKSREYTIIGQERERAQLKFELPFLRSFWNPNSGGEGRKTRRTILSYLEFFFFLSFLDLISDFHSL